ncbi:hypothetical protein FH972_012731 [Carpinus fangiana]|uniref:Putative plant transposon protein domain-containing protein n=1 Tax=Carpinus fangiana TaxID=176857 RepID=A0A5N6R4P3_9ROSI|nr:hypothetical protein FH972_012731 [Carpinus fangiana]
MSSRSILFHYFQDQGSKEIVHKEVQRKVKCSDFVDDFAFIPPLFEERGWKSPITPSIPPFEDMVKEFYANIEPIDLQSFRTSVRKKEFEVNRDLICSIIGVPLVNELTYPYLPDTFPDKEAMMMVFVDGTSPSWLSHQAKVKIIDFSEPMRTLSQIVSANIWLVGHYTDFGVDRAAFLFALTTGVPIDFSTHAIQLMLTAYEVDNSCLPFGCLITQILRHLGVEPLECEPFVRQKESFNKHTMHLLASQKKKKFHPGASSVGASSR